MCSRLDTSSMSWSTVSSSLAVYSGPWDSPLTVRASARGARLPLLPRGSPPAGSVQRLSVLHCSATNPDPTPAPRLFGPLPGAAAACTPIAVLPRQRAASTALSDLHAWVGGRPSWLQLFPCWGVQPQRRLRKEAQPQRGAGLAPLPPRSPSILLAAAPTAAQVVLQEIRPGACDQKPEETSHLQSRRAPGCRSRRGASCRAAAAASPAGCPAPPPASSRPSSGPRSPPSAAPAPTEEGTHRKDGGLSLLASAFPAV